MKYTLFIIGLFFSISPVYAYRDPYTVLANPDFFSQFEVQQYEEPIPKQTVNDRKNEQLSLQQDDKDAAMPPVKDILEELQSAPPNVLEEFHEAAPEILNNTILTQNDFPPIPEFDSPTIQNTESLHSGAPLSPPPILPTRVRNLVHSGPKDIAICISIIITIGMLIFVHKKQKAISF